jgi:hypothetical protein
MLLSRHLATQRLGRTTVVRVPHAVAEPSAAGASSKSSEDGGFEALGLSASLQEALRALRIATPTEVQASWLEWQCCDAPGKTALTLA